MTESLDQTNRGAESSVEYLPEGYYLEESHRVTVADAFRITARCLGRDGDRFEMWSLLEPTKVREGVVPSSPPKWHKVVEELAHWLEPSTYGRMNLAAFNLRRGSRWVWNAHDGLPGLLSLSDEEFAALQECWQIHGLPRDLYYPKQELRVVTEPAQRFGGTIRIRRGYSPLQWLHRDHAAFDAIAIPSEGERRRKFVEDCRRFAEALQRRQHELTEPEQVRDAEELSEVNELWRATLKLAARVQGESDPAG